MAPSGSCSRGGGVEIAQPGARAARLRCRPPYPGRESIRRPPWRRRRKRWGRRNLRSRCAVFPAVRRCNAPTPTMFGPGSGESPGRGRLAVRVPQHVGFVVAVVGQAEEIAVAAEFGAERGRHRKAVHLRAQQNLRGIQRPGGEHHFAGIQRELRMPLSPCTRAARGSASRRRRVSPATPPWSASGWWRRRCCAIGR